MKLIVNRLAAEFNKIFAGTKRVGDSLKLEGKRMSELDVLNASKLGYKTESTLSVDKAVTAQKSGLLQSFDINGDANVDGNGNIVYIKENQLRVHNSQFLRDVAPENLEVDVARRLKVGDQADSPIINVSSLVTHPSLFRVKDSGLLGGKTEDTLYVQRAKDADSADLLNDTAQADLVVEKSRIATMLLSDDGSEELKESELRVHDATYLRNGTTLYNLYQLRDYFFSTDQAKAVYVNLSAASNTLTTTSGNKSFADIMDFIKTDTDSEAYKAKRIITAEGVKTGDEYKTWLIAHNDFKAKVATLNAATADRAVRFGDASDNVTISEMDTRIKGTVVDLAANATKLQNNTPDDLFTTIRSRILSDASNGTTGLTQGEVDGFFGNNKVKLAVQGIKPTNAGNADTLEGYTRTEIKDQIKAEGQVLSAKYIYSDPNGSGQKSYIDITNDITTAKSDLIDGASSEYMTLGRTEDVIVANKSAIESSLSAEITNRTNADNTLQSNIDTESARIDTILSGADTDKNTFSEIRTYIDTLTGDLTTSTTALPVNDPRNVVNITNELESRLVAVESSTGTSDKSVGDLENDILDVATAVGAIATTTFTFNKNDANVKNANYISSATSVINASKLLDTALKAEESARITADSTLLTKTNDNATAISDEITRATTVEGNLGDLTTSSSLNLVSAINSLKTALDTEATTRTNEDDTLNTKIGNNTTAIQNETTRAKGVEGLLSDLTTTAKSTLVAAINENKSSIGSEYTRATTAEGTLQTNIDTVQGNLDTEASTRATADTTLQGNIDTVVGNLSTETTNRTNADTTLQTNIDTVQGNLDTEASTRATADTTLQGNIDTESGRIDAIVAGLGFSDIETNSAVTFSGTNYLDSKTTANDAVVELDTQLGSRFSNLDTRVTAIATTYGDDGTVDFNASDLAFDDGTNKKVSIRIYNDPLSIDADTNPDGFYEVASFTGRRDNEGSTIAGNFVINTYLDVKQSIFTSGAVTGLNARATSALQILADGTYRSIRYDLTDGFQVEDTAGTMQQVMHAGNIAGAVSDLGSVTKDSLDTFLGSAKNDTAYTDIGGPNDTVADITTYLTTSTSFFESDVLLDAAIKSVDDRVTTLESAGGSGSGDMLKSTYDTTDSGIVDNAELVNGLTVETAVPADAVFTDTVYDDSAVTGRLDTLEGAGYLTSETDHGTVVLGTDTLTNSTDGTGLAISSTNAKTTIDGFTIEASVPSDAVFTDTVVGVTYTTQEAEITDSGDGSPTLTYIFNGVLTHADTLVFSAGLKLRKQDTIYTLTDNGDDTTTLTVVDTTKFTVGEFIEIETITVA